MVKFGTLVFLSCFCFIITFGTVDSIVHRDVKCKVASATADFHTITCLKETGVIGLLDVKFGYQNTTTENCTNSKDTTGCEESMSQIQLRTVLNQVSAQGSYGALQFPQVDTPKYCHGYEDKPTYMAYYYECLKLNNILSMCEETNGTGSEISVYNRGYPGDNTVSGTHHCFCHVTSGAPSVNITVYDYTLNCTDNNQSVHIYDQHGTVLPSKCGRLVTGQYTASSTNLTIAWDGELRRSGRFWVGFRASDDTYNVSMKCSFIPDPTTTTTTTTTTPPAIITTHTRTPGQSPVRTTSIHTTVTDTTSMVGNTSEQTSSMSKTLLYSLIGGGGALLVIIVVIICVLVKRRNNTEATGPVQLDVTHVYDNTRRGPEPTTQIPLYDISSNQTSTTHQSNSQSKQNRSTSNKSNKDNETKRESQTSQGSDHKTRQGSDNKRHSQTSRESKTRQVGDTRHGNKQRHDSKSGQGSKTRHVEGSDSRQSRGSKIRTQDNSAKQDKPRQESKTRPTSETRRESKSRQDSKQTQDCNDMVYDVIE